MSELLEFHGPGEGKIKEVRVKPGTYLSVGKIILLYQQEGKEIVHKFKSGKVGKVEEIFVKSDEDLKPGARILKISGGCSHPTIMKDMCAECGADLKNEEGFKDTQASVSMVHSIPELKVSNAEAASLGQEDQKRLLKDRKLVLLVDLDQTLIHTTNDNIPPNLRDVYHFQLYGSRSPWYHTRIRPKTKEFLSNISHLYEFHICTFGARMYAHTIAAYLDPEGKYFSHRILSRDECFDSRSKTANMSALFPCGDSMVCIIDDREDVWNYAPNLVHVKPYHFFQHTGDINAPPGLSKQENDEKEGVDFSHEPFKKKISDDEAASKEGGKKSATQPENPEIDESSSDEDKPQPAVSKKVEPRRESIDMPVIDENSNQGKDAKVKTTDNGVDSASASKDGDKDTKDAVKETESVPKDGDKVVKDTVEDVNNDLEMSDSEDSRDCSAFKKDAEKKKVVSKDDDKERNLMDVEDPDDYLFYLEDILRTVHKAYYDLHDQMTSGEATKSPDLKTVIPYVKRKVLQGVNIVFSGVVPTQVPLERSKPFLLAKSMGATVGSGVTNKTTHLVAARLGTAKINDAKKQGRSVIVTPDWLWACAERWERVDERLFPLGKLSNVTRKPPAHCSSPEIAFAERCADIELNLEGGPGYNRHPSVVESDPFLAFSSDDIKGMDKEVEDVLSGESDTDKDSEDLDDDEEEVERRGSSSSEEEFLSEEQPRGHKRKSGDQCEDDEDEDSNLEQPLLKFQRGEELPSDFEVEAQSDDEGQDEDWSLMGAELERELGS